MTGERLWLVTCRMAKASWAFPFNSAASAQNYVGKAMALFQDLPEGKVKKVRGGVRMSSSIWRVPFDVSIVSVDRRYVDYMLVKYDHKEYVETRRFSKWLNAANFVHVFATELGYKIDEDEDNYGEWSFVDSDANEDVRFKLFIFVTGRDDSMAFINHCYQVLGVQPDSSDEVVKKAYKKLIMKTHPDHGGDEDDFKKVQEAYTSIVAGRQNNGVKHKLAIKDIYDAVDFKLLITDMANDWFDDQRTAQKQAREDDMWAGILLVIIVCLIALLIYGISQGWRWAAIAVGCIVISSIGRRYGR